MLAPFAQNGGAMLDHTGAAAAPRSCPIDLLDNTRGAQAPAVFQLLLVPGPGYILIQPAAATRPNRLSPARLLDPRWPHSPQEEEQWNRELCA
jgi:hypothetical protein